VKYVVICFTDAKRRKPDRQLRQRRKDWLRKLGERGRRKERLERTKKVGDALCHVTLYLVVYYFVFICV